jgi:hypothetical protein
MWGMGLVPAFAALFDFATRGLPHDFVANEPGVWLGMASSVLPLAGFGLLGLAAWRQSERLAIAGIAVVLVYMAIISGAFMFSFWQ